MKNKLLSGLLALAMTVSLSAFPAMAEDTSEEYAITDSTAVRLLEEDEELSGYIKELDVLPGLEGNGGEEDVDPPKEEEEEPVDPSGYELLYYNPFDNGAVGGPAALNCETDYFNLTVQSEGGWNTATFEGNTGVATNSGAWPRGRNFLFDFAKIGGVSGGIYKFSWDFSGGSGGGDVAWTGMNMSNHYEGGRLIGINRSNGVLYFNPVRNHGDWGDGPKVALDLSKKYHVEYVMDMDTKKATTYLDGQYIGTTALSATMNNFTLNICGYVDYFDNLKLEKWDIAPEFKAEIGEVTLDGAEINTTAEVKDWAEFAKGISVKRIFDGKELTASVTPITASKAMITSEGGFVDGYNYEIVLPEAIEGLSGESFTLKNNKINAEFATQNAVKSIKVKNYAGVTVNIEAINSTELESVVIEFTDDVDVEAAMANVSIKERKGFATTNTKYKAKIDGNVAELVFDDLLKANKDYTISIKNLVTNYSQVLKTGAGSVSVKAVKLYNETGKELTKLSDISIGDTVKAKLEIANTTGESTEYLGTITMYNGKLITGIGFESTSVSGNTKTVSEFEFKISNTNELVFTGLMWHKDKTMPLAKAMTFEIK